MMGSICTRTIEHDFCNKPSGLAAVLQLAVSPISQAASGDESPIPWNFAKFLVKKDGTVFAR